MLQVLFSRVSNSKGFFFVNKFSIEEKNRHLSTRLENVAIITEIIQIDIRPEKQLSEMKNNRDTNNEKTATDT